MLVDQGTKSGQTRHPCSSSYIAHCGASASLHLKPQTSSAWSNRNCHKSIEASRGDTPRCGHLAAAPTRNPQELHRTLTWRRSEISSWPAALRSRHLEPKYTQRTEIQDHSAGTQQTLMFLAIFQWRIAWLTFGKKKVTTSWEWHDGIHFTCASMWFSHANSDWPGNPLKNWF